MRSTTFPIIRLFAPAFLLLFIGCQGSDRASASGTVKFDDGSALQIDADKGDMATVNFQPKSPECKHATGEVAADGSFTVTSGNAGEGILPGEYQVVVNYIANYPSPPQTLTPEPATVTVQKGGKNHWSLVVPKKP